MENKVFIVNGMKCEHCKLNVEQALKSVEVAEVNLAEKIVNVSYDENLVKPELLKSVVDALGRFEMIL